MLGVLHFSRPASVSRENERKDTAGSAAVYILQLAEASAVILTPLVTDCASSSSGRWCSLSTLSYSCMLHTASLKPTATLPPKDLMLLSHWNNFPALFRAFWLDSPPSSSADNFKSER